MSALERLLANKACYSFEALNTDDYNLHLFENNPKNPIYVPLRKSIRALGMTLIKSQAEMAKKLGLSTAAVVDYDIPSFDENHDEEYYDSCLLDGYIFVVITDKANKEARALAMLYARSNEGVTGLYVSWVVVTEDFQGKGYSKVLFESIESFARDRQYDHLNLNVLANNKNAIKVYEREGFKSVFTEMYKDLK